MSHQLSHDITDTALAEKKYSKQLYNATVYNALTKIMFTICKLNEQKKKNKTKTKGEKKYNSTTAMNNYYCYEQPAALRGW
jgi:hypothetical protein